MTRAAPRDIFNKKVGGGVTITFVIIAAVIDISGRIATLLVLMQHSAVKTLTFRTWTLLCAFLNFAWVFYFPFGYKKGD